jgi:hypothetical protein
MRLRGLVVTAALAFAGACAHGKVLSDTVSDEALARVPASQMAPVNQARLDVSKAQDTLAREKLRLDQAKKSVDVAGSEVAIAKAELDRDQAAKQAADSARNPQAATEAQSAMGLARQKQQAAEAHVQAGDALVGYAQERVTAAQKAVDLANARLELAKYKVLKASGDKAVADVDGDAIQKRVQDTRVALEQERAKVSQAKASAVTARKSWMALRGQLPADQRFGVGGSGNLSGKAGTNQTPAGTENLGIDSKNTDPNRGLTSSDPNSYDDQELFNLL